MNLTGWTSRQLLNQIANLEWMLQREGTYAGKLPLMKEVDRLDREVVRRAYNLSEGA